jgi:hypothetical protein
MALEGSNRIREGMVFMQTGMFQVVCLIIKKLGDFL